MSAENSKKIYSKGPKDKVQFNASISSSFAEAIRDYSIMDGCIDGCIACCTDG